MDSFRIRAKIAAIQIGARPRTRRREEIRMRMLLTLLVLLLALPLMAQAECTSCGGNRSESSMGCKCPSFTHYTGTAELTGLRIEAEGVSTASDEMHLLLRDVKMRKVADITLDGPHNGKQEYDYEITMPGTDFEMAVLVNNTNKDVKMTFLRITGVMSDGSEFVYFEQECPGVVIGQGGCPRMILFDGGMEKEEQG